MDANVTPQLADSAEPTLSPWKLGGLSVRELAKRVWKSANDDDIFGRSAQLAYYFFFALFPGLIFLSSVLGLLASPGTQLHDSLLRFMGTVLPGSAFAMVQQVLDQTTQASGGGKLTFGILVALWSATQGMVAVQDTMNAVYNVREGRPLWKSRGNALGLTLVCGVLLIAALTVILYGNTLANFIGARVGLSTAATRAWKIGQLPVALFFLSLVFAVTYYAAPDLAQRHWEWLTPGAVVGMTSWIIASAALRLYLHFFKSYTASYGSLGAVIILLTWFYVTGLMLLTGAEVNAEIANAAAKRG
jgi:membrane protein